MAADEQHHTTLVVATLLFVICGTLTMWHHECWRDELQAWLLARNTATIGSMLDEMRYEGHPPLWHLCLRFCVRCWDAPEMMQLCNLLIVSCAGALLLCCAPFRPFIAIGLTFHYLIFYEYLIISRSYGLGLLLVLLAVHFDQSRPKITAFALLLLCQTSVYGAILAIAFVIAAYRDEACSGQRPFFIAVAIGVAVMILAVMPPADSGVFHPPPTSFHLHLTRSLATLFNGLMPVLEARTNPWSRNPLSYRTARAILGVMLFVACCLVLRDRSERAVLFFSLSSIGIVLFSHFVYYGHLRHHGHIFIAFLVALWLGKGLGPTRWHRILVGAMIAAGLTASVQCHWRDLHKPFSAARETANGLRTSGLSEQFLCGEADAAASAVGAYLGKEIFYLRGRRLGTYIRWDEGRVGLDAVAAIGEARRRARQAGKALVLVSNRPLPNRKSVIEFTNSMVNDERYWIYLLDGQHPVR